MKEENKLYQKLRALIRQKNKEVLEQLKKLDRIPSSDIELKALLLPLTEAIVVYTNIIIENTKVAIRTGMTRTISALPSVTSLVIDFNEFSEEISKLLKEKTFIASEHTIDRITGNVMQNLKESYEAGYGIDEAADNLKNVFEDMEGHELKRVARTEINGAQNKGAYQTMVEIGVNYQKWWTAQDSKVRGNDPKDTADHVHMHGQIVRVGEPFSNGLYYPGDRSGDISEWIECRCTPSPFIMPEGFKAPAMDYFYESDLIRIT